MLLYCRYFIIAECYTNKNVQKDIESENHCNIYSPENIDNIILNLQTIDNNLIASNDTINPLEITPTDLSGYGSNFSSAFQQQYDTFSLSNNYNYSNSYYGNDPIFDQNFIVEDKDIVCNNVAEKFNEPLPPFATFLNLNDVGSHQATYSNGRESINYCNVGYNEPSTSTFINLSGNNSKFNGYKPTNINNERKLTSKESTITGDNKRQKTNSFNFNHSLNQNNSQTSIIKNIFENKNYKYDEISEKEPVELNKSQSNSIKKYKEKIRDKLYILNRLKNYEQIILNFKHINESYYTILNSDMKQLSDLTEYAKKLCKSWIQKSNDMEDSAKNIAVFDNLIKLASNIASTVITFKTFLNNRTFTSSEKEFSHKNQKLKNKIEKNKKLLENSKLLGISNILEDDNSEDNSINSTGNRSIDFIYQEENDSNIKNFKITLKPKFYFGSFSLFEESIFICICNPNQYLKILKVNLQTAQYSEFSKYVIFGEENDVDGDPYFGFGSKHTIIRSGSEGKLFILKSPLKKSFETIKDARHCFEILVVDNKLKMLACVQIDTFKPYKNVSRPVFLDLVCHNDRVYALDAKCNCIRIFNESLKLLKTIPVPRSLIQTNIHIHFAVSSKYIFIGIEKTIFYIKNNGQDEEFKRIESKNNLLNIACYGEDYIIIRLYNICYAVKIEENLCAVKYTPLPSLNSLKGLNLTNFIVKDNFVYAFCVDLHRIYKLKFTLNAATGKIN